MPTWPIVVAVLQLLVLGPGVARPQERVVLALRPPRRQRRTVRGRRRGRRRLRRGRREQGLLGVIGSVRADGVGAATAGLDVRCGLRGGGRNKTRC